MPGVWICPCGPSTGLCVITPACGCSNRVFDFAAPGGNVLVRMRGVWLNCSGFVAILRDTSPFWMRISFIVPPNWFGPSVYPTVPLKPAVAGPAAVQCGFFAFPTGGQNPNPPGPPFVATAIFRGWFVANCEIHCATDG